MSTEGLDPVRRHTVPARPPVRLAPLVLELELHRGQALALDALMLLADSQTLGLTAMLVLAQPRLAQQVGLKYDVKGAAERAFDYLVSKKGWTTGEVLAAGSAAVVLVMRDGLPPSTDEVKEAEVFSEPAPADMPALS